MLGGGVGRLEIRKSCMKNVFISEQDFLGEIRVEKGEF